MNTRLKIALIRRYSNQGFALPIAMGMGLIMLLIAATLMMRSQGDQTTALAQKSTAQSLGITETGITRVQSFLSKNPGFLTQSYPWTTYLTNLRTSCTSGTLYTQAQQFNDWITVGNGNDRFKVISYTPSATEGVLLVEGQTRQGSNVKSTARIQVKIPFDRSRLPSFDPPGVWAQNFGLGNNRIIGNVIDGSCPPGSLDTDEINQISGIVTNNPGLTLPPPLPVPTVCTGSQQYPNDCGAMPLNAITSDLILPRNSDNANTNGEYIYYVAKSGNNSIDLSGNDKLVIKPGTKVRLYLEGNINTQGGRTKIGHNCYDTSNPPDGESDGATQVAGCTPTNFQMFGGIGTTSIIFGGSNTVDAFIFAPNAVQSGVNGSAQIRGSIWLKEWDRANGNHTVVVQTATWNNIPTSLWPARISPISSWQRQETP